MRNILFVPILALALVAISPATFAQTPTPRADLHAMFAQLGVTPDQKAQLRALHEKMHEQELTLREAVHDAQKQFAVALLGDAEDPAMQSAHDALVKTREAYAAFRFSGMLAVRQILTPEQRKKFAGLYIDNHIQRDSDNDE